MPTMTSDGSSDSFALIIVAGIVSFVILLALGVGTWFHKRSEDKADKACAAIEGIRLEIGHDDYCIKRNAILTINGERNVRSAR
jgi:hypothetical protein